MYKMMIRKIEYSTNPTNIIISFNNGLYKEVSINDHCDIYTLVMAAYISCSVFNCIFYDKALDIAESIRNTFGYPEEFLAQVDSCLTNFSFDKESDDERYFFQA